jgi:hypothetical protein
MADRLGRRGQNKDLLTPNPIFKAPAGGSATMTFSVSNGLHYGIRRRGFKLGPEPRNQVFTAGINVSILIHFPVLSADFPHPIRLRHQMSNLRASKSDTQWAVGKPTGKKSPGVVGYDRMLRLKEVKMAQKFLQRVQRRRIHPHQKI